MKNTKKTLAALLALLTVTSLMLTSCGGDTTSDTPDVTDANAETTAAVTEPEVTEPQLELPEGLDLEGMTATFLIPPSQGWVQQRDFVMDDSSAGEPIHDASRERISTVEDLLNVKIEAIQASTIADVINKARTEVMAGGDTYDVVMPQMIDVKNMANEGQLIDLFTVNTIDIDKPWYSQTSLPHITIGNKLFFVIGDLSLIDNDGVGPIGFNKKLIEDNNLEMPYDDVINGTWTMDKLFTMASQVSRDLNGDGVMDVNDLYGFVTDGTNLQYFLYAANITFVEKDDDDMPVPSINNERTMQVIDKFLEFSNDKTRYAETDLFGGHEKANTSFMNDQMLFRQTTMYRFTQMRDMETDFGFVTVPKFDESQENYQHGYSYASPGVAIPVTVSDVESVGAVVEAMSYYGRELLLPAYYDVTLQSKVARDDESQAVLDILFDTALLDLGIIYNFGGLRDIWKPLVTGGQNNFQSTYAGLEAKMLSEIEAFVEVVKELD